jgi:hypothetical protein
MFIPNELSLEDLRANCVHKYKITLAVVNKRDFASGRFSSVENDSRKVHR